MNSDSEVKVSVFAPPSTYDIKIFFTQDDSEIPGEINVNGEWKNSRYYIQDIEFGERQFEIRLKNNSISSESLSICVRLREFSSTSTPSKQCISIKLNTDSNVKIEKTSSQPSNSQSSTTIKENAEDILISSKQYPNNTTNSINQNSNFIALDNSPIILKSSSETSLNTSLGKSRIALNVIVAIAALLTIYAILRSESKYREI